MQSQKESLQIGATYLRDLVDENDKVLVASGTVVTDEILHNLIAEGTKVVRVAPEVISLDLHQAQDLKACRQLLSDAAGLVEDISASIQARQEVSLKEVDSSVTKTLELVQNDYCALLSTAIKDLSGAAANRNVKISAMAMIAAREMNFPADQCQAVGRAGLLCDVGLPIDETPLNEVSEGTSEYDKRLAAYIQHPLTGKELLQKSSPGMGQLELVLISQTHEQCDGTGFPRGSRKQLLHPLSRLLNAVDAFLTLTNPEDDDLKIMPSDAMAYLVQHALYGTFDLECVKAIIRTTAVYPVGTEVIFEDAEVGEVIRNAAGDYLDPIVLMEGEQAAIAVGDKRRKILAPIDEQDRWRRLPKSMMDHVLWHRAG